MARALPEWIGKTPDTKVPDRVRLRVFEREAGKCWISGRKIRPGDLWDLDHQVALINGGEHRESNLFPALRDKHREKTRHDVAEKAKSAAVRSKHLGIRPRSQWQSQGFQKVPPQRTASKPIIRKSERSPA
jgi:5-methylcytosine-specific restriction endonuclease McrA